MLASRTFKVFYTSEDGEEVGDAVGWVIKEVKNCVLVTPLDYMNELSKISEEMTSLINKKAKRAQNVSDLKRFQKKIQRLEKYFPKVMKNSRKRSPTEGGEKKVSNSGFNKKYSITEDAEKFFKVKKGTKMTPQEIMSAIGAYIYLSPDETRENVLLWKKLNTSGRDLRDPTDKRKINPNRELSELLGYDKYVKEVKQGKITKKTGTKNSLGISTKKDDEVVTDHTLYRYVINKLVYKNIIIKE